MKITDGIKMLTETLSYAGKDEEVFMFVFTKDEAIELIMNNMDDAAEMTEEGIGEIFDSEQMEKVTRYLNQNEGVWQELNESFVYIVEKLWKEKRNGKSKSDSQELVDNL